MLTMAKKPAKPAPSPFGELLRRKRMAAGLTQTQLAERTGIAVAILSRLETSNRANPNLESITRLAAGIGCQPSELVPSVDGDR